MVDHKHVGNGSKALTYLYRHLCREALPEKDIFRCGNDQTTFTYTD